ncbi:pyrimidine-nucleoside phosphorylase [Alkaliphilus sp. MSJ-5]|uniref:Pyrimidine-nucleoside phosphorylase n=1 Tax=Alkaliphilus flagellatus TaxID=2841507 RepID=A0ABS6G5V1_9FIRM|nr:pyrimidine-nucleoside phosphorylase [Alkaliphilus flagellatus]MBU5677539.1 pyrimidine-nucleoside phosphorylase [Alkaliphilus flagellatus]
MRMYDLIFKKRNGGVLSKKEINYFIKGYTDGDIPDYQASALLMAIYFQKMNECETADLTEAMMNSGDIINLNAINGIKVDKHSTGGVGDKTTIALAPIVAACGVPVAKMSGRGLGHTGGTLDKLESIPGFSVDMAIDKFINNVNNFKIAVAGQTANLAPADKIIYALRDVTATVDNISLIASSIMCKKLASGADSIVLDVKTGSGAFMQNIDDAFELAQEMVKIGNNMGRDTIALVTNMDQPLGNAVGNSLEIKEAIETLKGGGPEDFKELCITLGSYMLLLARCVETVEEGRRKVENVISTGKAFDVFKTFVIEQGGDVSYVENIDLFPKAKGVYELKSEATGYINKIEADVVGLAALTLGAGRETKESVIDLTVGIVLNKKVGDYVQAGETLAYIHYNNDDKRKDATEKLKSAYLIEEASRSKSPLLFGIVTCDGIKRL